MTQAQAEILALKALSFLANSEDGLARLCSASGLNMDELRARAEDPAVLAAILDFLLQDEGLLVAFCDAESINARDLHVAAHRLTNP